MHDKDYRDIFDTVKTIAVVGLSDKPDRPSRHVAKYLKSQGYKIIPVNPMVKTVFGLKSYSTLLDIKEKVCVVDIFRRPEFVPEFVDQAIQIGASVIWMQEGIVSEKAAKKARAHGLTVIMDRCMMKEHRRLKKSI